MIVTVTLAFHPLLGEPIQDGPAVVAEGAARVVGVHHPGVGQRTALETRGKQLIISWPC